MRAKDLVNKVCVFRPLSLGEWPAKAATETEKAMKAQPYVECDVWVLDRQGITEEGTGVRVGWWKAVEQLKACGLGSFVPAKPRTEEGSNAIYLAPLTPEARQVATQVIAALEAPPNSDEPQPDYDPDEEPF